MRKVFISSPYAGKVEENLTFARRALRDSINRGECPIATHLLYTQPGVLDDSDPLQREKAFSLVRSWLIACELLAVYTDRGVSLGMTQEVIWAKNLNMPIEYRVLGEDPS